MVGMYTQLIVNPFISYGSMCLADCQPKDKQNRRFQVLRNATQCQASIFVVCLTLYIFVVPRQSRQYYTHAYYKRA